MATFDLRPGERIIISEKPTSLILIGHGIITIFTFFLWLPIFIYKILQIVTTKYILTNRRIIFEKGVLSKSSMESPLDKIQNVSHFQSLFGRFLNYGNVRLQTASSMGMTMLCYVPNPKKFKADIVNQVELHDSDRLNKSAKAIKSEMSTQANPETLQIPDGSTKVCPQCAETVKQAAKVCRYCSYKFEEEIAN